MFASISVTQTHSNDYFHEAFICPQQTIFDICSIIVVSVSQTLSFGQVTLCSFFGAEAHSIIWIQSKTLGSNKQNERKSESKYYQS